MYAALVLMAITLAGQHPRRADLAARVAGAERSPMMEEHSCPQSQPSSRTPAGGRSTCGELEKSLRRPRSLFSFC